MKQLKRVFIGMLLILVLCLAGCAQSNAPTEATIPKWPWERKKAESLILVIQPEDFEVLEKCENLKYLDVSGSTCYKEIQDYMYMHPQVEVIYTVPLGNVTVYNTTSEITLQSDDFDLETLQKNLDHLPELRHIKLVRTTLTDAELDALQGKYPAVEFTYTLDILGQEYGPDITQLDLSSADSAELEQLLPSLSMLYNIAELQLMTTDNTSQLELTDVKQLMELFPEAAVNYSFDLFGQTASTQTETLEYKNQDIGNAGEERIRQALDIMPDCTQILFDDCGFDSEVLASIREDYPDTEIVWRVHFGKYNALTNAEMLRSVYNVFDDTIADLRYCNDVKYIDFGHNTELTDLSFVQYMPNLEIFIGSGCSVKTLEGFENCKKLEFLELANCYALTDAAILSECENLRFLNISFTKIPDLSFLDDLKLERFLYLGSPLSQEERTAFEEKHPECWSRFTGKDPYNIAWRYDDIGQTFSEYYLHVREVFDYDAVDRELARQKALEED